jgi:hypothetical protein
MSSVKIPYINLQDQDLIYMLPDLELKLCCLHTECIDVLYMFLAIKRMLNSPTGLCNGKPCSLWGVNEMFVLKYTPPKYTH